MTLNHLTARLQLWRFGECWPPLHWHWSYIRSDLILYLKYNEIYLCIFMPSDGNYTRMLRAILNKSWRQHPKKHQLYDHLPPITKPIKIRRTRHAGPCWRCRDELISDVLLGSPSHGRAKVGRPVRAYIQQLCANTGCSSEDVPEVMGDMEEWQERVWDIPTDGRHDDYDDLYALNAIRILRVGLCFFLMVYQPLWII